MDAPDRKAHNKVLWSEGMFLQPQHFQQQTRYLEALVAGRTDAVGLFDWGFAELVIDMPKLRDGKLALESARGLLRDGTPFEFPRVDEPPAPLEIPTDCRGELIVLALATRSASTIEVDLGDRGDDRTLTRFARDRTMVADNTRAEQQSEAEVEIGRLRLRLMRQSELTGAYTAIGVVRVKERQAQLVVLDNDYIAPTLALGASGTLAGFATDIKGRLHERGNVLAARLAAPGPGGVGEIANFLWLQTINRYEPIFAHMASVAALHPERLYETCVSLAGDLATFTRNPRRTATFPAYDHDDLQQTFEPVIADLHRSLSMEPDTSAVPIELQDRNYGVRVAIIKDLALLKSAGFILAVSAQTPADVLRTRFPAQTKIGPVERIRELVNLALPGIALRALPVAPRQIPYHAGNTYFELERGSELWTQLERSGGLALHIAGEFPGLRLEFWAIKA